MIMCKHASGISTITEGETEFNPSLAVSDSMRRRATIASVLGNALEWFDFVVYGLLSAMIVRLFFPSDNPTNSVLLGFATSFCLVAALTAPNYVNSIYLPNFAVSVVCAARGQQA